MHNLQRIFEDYTYKSHRGDDWIEVYAEDRNTLLNAIMGMKASGAFDGFVTLIPNGVKIVLFGDESNNASY